MNLENQNNYPLVEADLLIRNSEFSKMSREEQNRYQELVLTNTMIRGTVFLKESERLLKLGKTSDAKELLIKAENTLSAKDKTDKNVMQLIDLLKEQIQRNERVKNIL
ncbi:hypothetical protein JW911_03660 [Candidatus Peregrinibacteria bacterium]|nr:hypothetical protein [Candidatus Peregrinibacteria bacterium]